MVELRWLWDHAAGRKNQKQTSGLWGPTMRLGDALRHTVKLQYRYRTDQTDTYSTWIDVPMVEIDDG